MTNDSGGDGGAMEGMYSLDYPSIPHYYGDTVRRIFLGGAVFLLFVSPFLGRDVPLVLGVGIAGALVLALLGAITNPQKKWSMIANAIAAAICIFVAEVFALASFSAEEYLVFMFSEIFAIAFLFALYFSVKTVRAMFMGRMGKKDTVGEFLS